MNFGVQTFTVRREQKRSIRAAYLSLVALGIKRFEVARIDFNEKNAAEIKALVDECGIEICSVQVKPKYVFADPERIIAFCEAVGCRRVVISMLPFKCILGDEKKFYGFIGTLDGAARLYAERGITLAYHHHNWEYIRLSNGKTRMQELLERTQEIKFVHDTYWTAGCGRAPADQMREFGDRLLGVHLRDLTFGKKGIKVVNKDAPIGDGVIDFTEVIKAAREVGCQYLVIEQNSTDPYADIEKSYARLASICQRLDGKE